MPTEAVIPGTSNSNGRGSGRGNTRVRRRYHRMRRDIQCSSCHAFGHNRRSCAVWNRPIARRNLEQEFLATETQEQPQLQQVSGFPVSRHCNYCYGEHLIQECTHPTIENLVSGIQSSYHRVIRVQIVQQTFQEPYSNLDLIQYHTDVQLTVIGNHFGIRDEYTNVRDLDSRTQLISSIHQEFVRRTLEFLAPRISLLRIESVQYRQQMQSYTNPVYSLIENLVMELESPFLGGMIELSDTLSMYGQRLFDISRTIRLDEDRRDRDRRFRFERASPSTGFRPTGTFLNTTSTSIMYAKDYLKQMEIVYEVGGTDNELLTDCGICFDSFGCHEIIHTNCQHTYCYNCVEGYSDSIKDKTCKPTCPSCRTEWSSLTVHDMTMKEQIVSLMEEL